MKKNKIEDHKPLLLTHLGQVSRTVGNIEVAVKFFGEILGAQLLYTFGNLAFFDLEGTRLFLNESEAPNRNESILYFSVTDMMAACKELSDKGVKFTHQPHKIHTHEDGTEEWMTFFEDPDGRALGLMCSVAPAS